MFLSDNQYIFAFELKFLNMGFNYKQQYGVIVICKDEKEQKEVYDQLLAEGLTLKVVTV